MGATETFDLYVDDSGSRLPDKRDPLQRNDKIDAFAFGGYMVKSEDIGILITSVEKFKEKYEITCPLHSQKIRSKKDDFAWLGYETDRAREFYFDLSELMTSLPIIVTGCVIHRPGYNAKYKALYGEKRWYLCQTSYKIIVERAAKTARFYNRKLKVFVEECGKIEDKSIRRYHAELIENGPGFDREKSGKYNPMTNDGFSEILIKNPVFIKKKNPLAQIADLVLFPIVKGRYDRNYPPFRQLIESKKLVDLAVPKEAGECGIKYYRFDGDEFGGFSL